MVSSTASIVSMLSFIIVLSLLFIPASHALNIKSITFNVTNTTYGQYNTISLLVKGNQTGYNIAIQTFNLTAFEGSNYLSKVHILNDTTTKINITRFIGADTKYNLTLNISNSTLAGTTLKYNLTKPAYFNVSKATPALTVTGKPGNFTYNGTKDNITGQVVSTYNNVIESIGVSAFLPGLAITPNGQEVYVTNDADNAVSVINTSSYSIITKISGLISPDQVAITPNGQEVYVTNRNSNITSVINTSSYKIIKNVRVQFYPAGVAITPNGQFAYVTNVGNNTVSVINTSSYAVIKNITVQSAPDRVAITPNGKEAYVTNENSNTVSVINTSSYAVIKNITVQSYPKGVAITPNGQFVYVANADSNTVSVINTSSYAVIKTITGLDDPNGVAITPNGQFAYVVNYYFSTSYNSGTVSVINTSSYAVIKNISIDPTGANPEGVAITPNGQFAYVSDYNAPFDETAVSVINIFKTPTITANLYINGKKIGTTNNADNLISYLNASAGTYNAVFNTSGNANYTSNSVSSESVIKKAVLSQTLKAFPSASFTYDGLPPIMQDTLNASIVSGNSLSFDLVNNSLTAVSTSSSSTPFNFTALAGKYAAAGTYSYTSTSGGNSNYTVTGSPVYTVTISKATPALAVTDLLGNFTYNGTKDNITGQVISTLLHNDVIKNITVQTDPAGVAITSNGRFAYVVNDGSGTVSVINTSSYAVIKNITVQTDPYEVAITPNGHFAYVTNFYSGTVSVINTSSYAVIKNITVQTDPNGVAITPNGKFAYVANEGSKTVSVINTSSYAVIKNITVQSNPFAVAITPNGHFAYVTNEGSNTTSVINTSSYAVIKNITVQSNPMGVVITPNGQFAYVVNEGVGTVSIINTSSYAVIKNITVQSNPFAVAITPNGQLAYITNTKSNTTSVINTSSYGVIKNITVQSSPAGVAITPNGQFVYVANSGSNTTSVINIFTFPVTASLYINGKKISTTNTNNFISYLNASAGTYAAVFNTSGNANYTSNSVSSESVIKKAVLSQTLKAFPSASFVSNGTVPIIQDNLTAVTGAIISGNSLSFTLNSSPTSVVSNGSSTFPNASFNFTALPDSYKYPGSYSFVSSSAGNRNYTVTPSPFSVRIISGGGSIVPVITTNVSNFSLTVYRSGAEADYLVLSPSIYLHSSDFYSINVSFVPDTSNLTFSLFISGNLSSSVCSVSSVPDPIQGISILPSIIEAGVISGAKFKFSLGLNSQGRVSGYNLSPYEIVLYKCDVQNDSWIRIPTSYSVGQKSVDYLASSDSLSDYEIGSFALPSNVTRRIVTTVLETGLPVGYLYNATYDGSTRSASAPGSISFNTTAGSYPLILYALTNSSFNSTANCVTTYSPANFSSGVPKSIAAGSSVTVNYSENTRCLPVTVTPKAPSSSLSLYIVLLGVIAVIVILLIIYQLRKHIPSKKRSKHAPQK